MKTHKNLIVDLNNLIFITRYASIKTPSRSQPKEEYVTELIFKETLGSIVYFANTFKADSVVIACDSSNVWRKDIHPEYKAGRDHDDVYYRETIEAADLTKKFFRECTNAAVIEVPRCEADDIIGVFVQESEGVENVILSSDKDFIQLIDENTTLYSPAQKTWRESDDGEYELFLKCIRGDRGDNILSAYPRVRETKLKEAWDDPYKMQNLMETVRKDGQKVKDAFDFNTKLIDLSMQPDDIREDIVNALNAPYPSNYGELKMMAWLGKHNLKEHADMLSFKERPLKKKFILKNDDK